MSTTASYRAIHSDFIVHWTGKDIDADDSEWQRYDTCKVTPDTANRYIKRLKSILAYGLWMTRDSSERELDISQRKILRPTPFRTCFTELRLSEARLHARRYGRLGIGFKRLFLADRMGAPMIDFHPSGANWFVPPSRASVDEELTDYSSAYLKPMTSTSEHGMMSYGYYDESEWRIIYDDKIDDHLREAGRQDIIARFKRASDVRDSDFRDAVSAAPQKPGYLIPVRDQWLALIIYPALAIKVRAQADPDIRSLLADMKRRFTCTDIGHRQSPADFEEYDAPIEMALDSCKNF